MRYLKAGSGPALILVHGLLGYSFSWRFSIPALSLHFTVYAIDNLGAGFSTSSGGMDCCMRATAERVLEFADVLNIGSYDLMGTSLGGAVAILTAVLSKQRNDPRLKRLILVAPVNPWSPHGRWLAPFIGRPLGSVIFRHTIARWRKLDYLWLRRLFGDGARIPADSLEGYRLPVLKNHALYHGLKIVKTWKADLQALERALPQARDYPTLLVWGSRDRAVSVESAQPLQKNFRDCQLVVFEGVGHLPYEEAAEQFNGAVIKFLR